MVVDSIKPFQAMLAGLIVPLLWIAVYAVGISLLDLQYHLEDYNFPVTINSLLGTVIGLLVAFRTNSSYGRWWEARTLWGRIVNDSRTWTRQLLEFTDCRNDQNEADPVIRAMALRQAAWCYSLSRNLRRQDPLQDLTELSSAEEIESWRSSQNVPNEILLWQAKELRSLYDENRLELYQFVELERTLSRLTDSMGGCERIKNTPFPQSYSRLVHGMIYAFAFFLPLGLVKIPAVGLVLISLAIPFGFLAIEQVAVDLQEPFSNRPSDTPMLTLSRTIEINTKQMLGDTDLPSKLEPVDGVYY